MWFADVPRLSPTDYQAYREQLLHYSYKQLLAADIACVPFRVANVVWLPMSRATDLLPFERALKDLIYCQ
jgi:hypothetical protein